jgi:hypothetical protein
MKLGSSHDRTIIDSDQCGRGYELVLKPTLPRHRTESEREPCEGHYALLIRTDAIRTVGVLRPPAQVGIGDLIKASDTPDWPYSGYPTFFGPPQVVSALDAAGNDACSPVQPHVRPVGRGRGERGVRWCLRCCHCWRTSQDRRFGHGRPEYSVR